MKSVNKQKNINKLSKQLIQWVIQYLLLIKRKLNVNTRLCFAALFELLYSRPLLELQLFGNSERLSLLMHSHGEDEVPREGSEMVVIVVHPGIGPEFHTDLILFLQKQRRSVRRGHPLTWLPTPRRYNVCSVFVETDSGAGRAVALTQSIEGEVVDPLDWGCEHPCGQR